MARRVTPAFARALLVLDAQPLSLLPGQDRRMTLLPVRAPRGGASGGRG